jgi:hypothetical protein
MNTDKDVEIEHLAYGEAAIMLLESVLIALVDKGVLSVDEVVTAVENTVETKRQMVAEGEHARISAVAAGALTLIANSMASRSQGRSAPEETPPID